MKPSQEGTRVEAEGDELGMRDYWDAKARENAMYFIHSTLDYSDTDEAEFGRPINRTTSTRPSNHSAERFFRRTK